MKEAVGYQCFRGCRWWKVTTAVAESSQLLGEITVTNALTAL